MAPRPQRAPRPAPVRRPPPPREAPRRKRPAPPPKRPSPPKVPPKPAPKPIPWPRPREAPRPARKPRPSPQKVAKAIAGAVAGRIAPVTPAGIAAAMRLAGPLGMAGAAAWAIAALLEQQEARERSGELPSGKKLTSAAELIDSWGTNPATLVPPFYAPGANEGPNRIWYYQRRPGNSRLTFGFALWPQYPGDVRSDWVENPNFTGTNRYLIASENPWRYANASTPTVDRAASTNMRMYRLPVGFPSADIFETLAPEFLPAPRPNGSIRSASLNNRIKEIVEPSPDQMPQRGNTLPSAASPRPGYGFQIGVAPNGKPSIRPAPGHVFRPPPPGQHERKAKGNPAFSAAWAAIGGGGVPKRILDATTEAIDHINAIFYALPAEVRQGVGESPYDRARAIVENFDQLDLRKAVVNVAVMNISDAVLGQMSSKARAGLNLTTTFGTAI